MRIDGTNKPKGVGSTSKTSKKSKSGAGFGSMVDDTDGASGNAPVVGSMPIPQLDALLSAQEAEDSTSEEAVRKAKKRADMLLGQLDQIRMGILTGGIPKTALQQLTHTISHHRESVMDPALGAILDEIDLRAQVELAKHQRD